MAKNSFCLVPLGLALLIAWSASARSVPAHPAKGTKSSPAPNWQAVHESSIVIDTHADTTGRFVDEDFDPSSDSGKGHWDLKKVRTGNLGAEFFSIWVDPAQYKGQYVRRTLDMIDSVYETVKKHPNEMVVAYSAQDIYAARSGPHKRLAALMGIEGGHTIENDPRLLREYYRLGVRYMTLTWMNSTDWAQSSGDIKSDPATGKLIDPGLTDAGRNIVREMNRLGMMVDVSHVSDRTFYHALTVSRAPVIASHSSSRAVTNQPRNMTDDMLVALARNGGVAQVNFYCGYLSDEYAAAAKKFRDVHPDEFKRYHELSVQYAASHSDEAKKQIDAMEGEMATALPRPPFKSLIDHIDHMVKVAGVDHVGIGSDFDGVNCLPQGIDSVADLPKISKALSEMGYSQQDIHKIMGGNLLRVFAEVEKVAKQLQTEKHMDSRREVMIPTNQ